MKKRFIAIVLSIMLIISSMPIVAVAAVDSDVGSTADNPYIINTEEEFLSFLKNANNESKQTVYYRLDADISSTTDTHYSSFTANNIVLEGNDHTIQNFSFVGSMFTKMSKSIIRNVNFNNINIKAAENSETVESSEVANLAVLAYQTDSNTYITNCDFDSCTVLLPTKFDEINASIVVVDNNGIITNCIVKSTSDISYETTDTDDEATTNKLGGIAVINNKNGYIINSISNVKFNISDNGDEFIVGGIVANNNKKIQHCYADTEKPFEGCTYGYLAADNKGIEKSIYKSNGSLYNNDNTACEDIYVTAAQMSKYALDYNQLGQNITPPVEEEDYALLWKVENSELTLSDDGKDAQVFIHIENTFYDTNWIKPGIKITFSDLFKESSVGVEDSNGNITKYSVKVGDYNNEGKLIQNIFTLECICAKEYTSINKIIMNANHNYVYNLDNVFENNGSEYCVQNFDVGYENDLNISEIYVYPYESTLTLTATKDYDQFINYKFEGKGTSENQFEITSEYELNCLASYVNRRVTYTDAGGEEHYYNQAHYVLKNDIELTSDFTPIGAYSNASSNETAFCGVFDGQSHTISNFTFNKDSSTDNNDEGENKSSYKGLFAVTEGIKNEDGTYQNAVIKNLNVLCASVKEADTNNPSNIKGILVGRAMHTTISGCVVSGNVSGGTQLGGIAGYAYYTDINNCGSTVDIKTYSPTSWAGGITGYAEHSNIRNCYASTKIQFYNIVQEEYLNLGGIAGYITDSKFDNTYYIYNVKSENDLKLGTVVSGMQSTTESTLKSDDFLRNLINYSDKAGFPSGWQSDINNINGGYPINCITDETIYAIQCVSSSIGSPSADIYTAKSGDTVTVTVNDNMNGIKITDSNRNDLDLVISNDSSGKYSFVMPSKGVRVVPLSNKEYIVGMGTESDPFVISTYEDLCLVSGCMYKNSTYECNIDGKTYTKNFLDACYELSNDIDCKNQKLIPLAAYNSSSNGFTGTFDGNGYTISHVVIVEPHDRYVYFGFFGRLNRATVKDLKLDNITIGNETDNTFDKYKGITYYIALFAGMAEDSTVTNVSITNSLLPRFSTADNIYGAVFVGTNGSSGDTVLTNCLFRNISIIYWGVSHFLIGDNTGNIKVYNCVFDSVNNCSRFLGSADNFYGENNYYTTYEILDDDKCNFEMITLSSNNIKNFAAEMSYKATTTYQSDGACCWSVDDNNNLALSMNDTPKAITKITYDSVFTDSSQVDMFDVSSIPEYAVAGEEVTLKYYNNASIINLKLETPDGELSYNVDKGEPDSKMGTITFTVPEGYVHITNNNSDIALIIPGHGTEEDPYRVSRADELVWIAKVICNDTLQYKYGNDDYIVYDKAYFVLENDIDMNGVYWYGIGTDTYYFNGTFDGQGYTINNLNQNAGIPDGARRGLFSILGKDAIVKNLYISNANVWDDGTYGAGSAVIAKQNKGTITHCMVLGSWIQLGDCYGLGGITGINNSGAVIDNCAIVNSSIRRRWGGSGTQTLGGIAQENNGTISNSYVYNCSLFNGTINNGAIVSSANTNIGTVTNCYYNIQSNSSYYDQNIFSGGNSLSDFNIGKITYLLNNGVTDGTQVWYQNIDNGEPVDEYPIFSGGTVYFFNIDEEIYTNFDLLVTDIQISPNISSVERGTDIQFKAIISPDHANNNSIIWTSSDTNIATVDDNGLVTTHNCGTVTITAIPVYNTNLCAEITFRVDLAKDENGNFIIRTYEDLYNMTTMVNIGKEEYVKGNYILANDIDAQEQSILPIGRAWSKPFKGTFDGQGYTISNLSIIASYGYGNGLFGYCSGTVKNLHMGGKFNIVPENSSVYNTTIGIVISYALKGCKVENVYSEVQCNFKGIDYIELGGIVGRVNAYYDSVVIKNCFVNNTYINNGSISISYYGGILGIPSGAVTIENCGAITNLDIPTKIAAGGLIGDYSIDSSDTILNCYSYGQFNNVQGNCGPIIGRSFDAPRTGKNLYYLDTMATGNYFYDGYGTACTAEQFASGEVAYLLNSGITDGTQAWYQNIDNGLTPDDYPVLLNNQKNTVYIVNKGYSNFKEVLDLDENGNYIIRTYEDLCNMADMVNSNIERYVNGNYILVNDIDCSNEHWTTPIGQTALYYSADPNADGNWGFSGIFNGNGHIIKNLSVTGLSEEDASFGLFGTVSGTVKNLGIENFTYTGAGKDSRVGAVAGQVLNGGKIVNCYLVVGSINTQVNTTNGVAGGIAGANYSGTIENCYTYDLTVSAGRTGGIVGDNYGDSNNANGTDRPGTIKNCYTSYDTICKRGTATDSLANVSVERYASGEIAYLLNSGITDGTQAWYQNIDNGLTSDNYPVLVSNNKNTVYYDTYKDFYSNNISLLDSNDLRVYHRVCDESGKVSSNKSQIICGCGTVDNVNKVITVYTTEKVERIGILMNQGADVEVIDESNIQGAIGIMTLVGYDENGEPYKVYDSLTSADILASEEKEDDIYTDANGCIFIKIGSNTDNLKLVYSRLDTNNMKYVSTEYDLVIEVIDSSMFATIGTVSKETMDETIIRGSSSPTNNGTISTVPPTDDKTTSSEQSENITNSDNTLPTGDTLNIVPVFAVILSISVFIVVFACRKKKD